MVTMPKFLHTNSCFKYWNISEKVKGLQVVPSVILKDQKLVMKTQFFSSQSQDNGTNLDGGGSLDQLH